MEWLRVDWVCRAAFVFTTVSLSSCGDDSNPGTDEPTSTGPAGVSSSGPTPAPDTDATSLPGSSGPGAASTTAVADDTTADETGSPIKLDVGGGQDGNTVRLTGRVVAPNGEIPIAGALVYVTGQPPAGIPDGVYCDECQVLGPNDAYAVTAPNGTFEILAGAGLSGGSLSLVVKKGQFMRIEPFEITVESGEQAVSEAQTRLPSVYDPAVGHYIPRIALGYASFADRLEDVLAKFGLGQLQIVGAGEKLVPGTEPFDIFENGGGNGGFNTPGTIADLVSDPDWLDDYHIVFLPCSGNTHAGVLDMTRIQNIRDWVAAGGRWYASDYSNEWLEHVFPDYQTLVGEPDNADGGSYSSTATILDDGLLAWLDALPADYKDINPVNPGLGYPTLNTLPTVETVGNYSTVASVAQIFVPDGMGGQVDVGHKVWLEGPGGGVVGDHPLTIAGTFGCGRLQFTSYHTTSGGSYYGLTPQELVLLYTILEIGVCQENPLPPPQG